MKNHDGTINMYVDEPTKQVSVVEDVWPAGGSRSCIFHLQHADQ